MRKCIVIASICLAASASLSCAMAIRGEVPADTARALDAYFRRLVDEASPGYAISISRGGMSLYEGCFGCADVEGRVPITSETRFDLASVSKHFTAAAVLKLVERGALSIDHAVGEYLVGWKGPRVTIAQLLTHSSGLDDYTGDGFEGSDADFAALDTRSHVEWLSARPAAFKAGTRFEYNNSGYALLAAIVERVSGKRFAEFLRDEFFGPLGMSNAFVLDSARGGVPGRALGYAYSDGRWALSMFDTAMTGDGNVFLCLDDFLKWEEAWWRDSIFPRALRDLAWAPIATFGEVRYAWGLFVDADPWGRCVSHSGGWYGASSYLHRSIPQELSIVILSNDEDADVERICRDVIRILAYR